jgi:hypothetical protein
MLGQLANSGPTLWILGSSRPGAAASRGVSAGAETAEAKMGINLIVPLEEQLPNMVGNLVSSG